ncbi:MAG: DUF5333 domain-containing protein [Paracoccaceae bacterium]
MLSKLRKLAIAGAVGSLGVGAPLAAPGQDLPPLAQNEYINTQLLAGFIGDLIDKNCSSISARKLVAFQKLYALRDHALSQGYSRAQIESFVDDRAEKARLRAIASDYLARAGARDGVEDSYCAIGRAEIANRTLTGVLLRAR